MRLAARMTSAFGRGDYLSHHCCHWRGLHWDVAIVCDLGPLSKCRRSRGQKGGELGPPYGPDAAKMYKSSSDVRLCTLWVPDGEDDPSTDVVDNDGGHHSGMMQIQPLKTRRWRKTPPSAGMRTARDQRESTKYKQTLQTPHPKGKLLGYPALDAVGMSRAVGQRHCHSQGEAQKAAEGSAGGLFCQDKWSQAPPPY